MKRNFVHMARLPGTSYIKFIVVIATALMTIIIFNNLGTDLKSIQNRNGALFFIALTIALNSVQHVTLIFPDERPVFLREVNNNMYAVTAYFFAKIGSEFPISVITPLLYGSIVYFAIGLSTVAISKFFIFLGILVLLYLSAGSYALILSSLLADKQLAVTLTPLLVIPFMLFAGFFVAKDVIPKYLLEIHYLSFFKYGY